MKKISLFLVVLLLTVVAVGCKDKRYEFKVLDAYQSATKTIIFDTKTGIYKEIIFRGNTFVTATEINPETQEYKKLIFKEIIKK